jgi:glycosyltransferase involved in cell wall biosynthesis
VYVVAGRTHPKVLAHQGDGYRRSLIQRVATNGVGEMVQFDNSYRDLSSLSSLIESADVVVLPYDSKDQATSGVLVDAIAAGRPVVATEFPHANELLATGAGITVAHKDAAALARALRRVLSDSKVAADMAREARFLASGLSWRAVAVQFQATADRLLHYSEVHV